MTSPWPWPKVMAVASIIKNVLVCAIKEEPLIGSLHNVAALLPESRWLLDCILEKFVLHCYFGKFSLFCPYLRNGWPIDVNEKEVHWLDTGYNLWPWPLTSLMTLTLDFSRSNFEIALSPELLVWCDMKRKWVNMTLGRLYDLALWPHPWSWRWSFKVRVWNSFIAGMGRPIDNERKGCESSIYDHDIDLCDHGGVRDVPDSDRGDFRRRRTVDISSLHLLPCKVYNIRSVNYR